MGYPSWWKDSRRNPVEPGFQVQFIQRTGFFAIAGRRRWVGPRSIEKAARVANFGWKCTDWSGICHRNSSYYFRRESWSAVYGNPRCGFRPYRVFSRGIKAESRCRLSFLRITSATIWLIEKHTSWIDKRITWFHPLFRFKTFWAFF